MTSSEKLAPNALSDIRRTVAVMSGKGGVGKSMVSCLLAVLAARRGLRTALLDADMTGPSVPRAFGLRARADEGPDGIFPVESKTGIAVMSVNLCLPQETDPLVWRGAELSGLVRRFWRETVFDARDLLLIDCPPGTGDVPLTVLRDLPVDGIVCVTTAQEAVTETVEKALRMAEQLGVKVLGLVENLSAYCCPYCGGTHRLFAADAASALARRHGIDATARLPLSPKLSGAVDSGMVELFEGDWLDALADRVLAGL